jgi:hypothetical protein
MPICRQESAFSCHVSDPEAREPAEAGSRNDPKEQRKGCARTDAYRERAQAEGLLLNGRLGRYCLSEA